MHVVHAYASGIIDIDDIKLPRHSLIEDVDGIRLLFIDSAYIPQAEWIDAANRGAQAILWLGADLRIRYISVERYAEEKISSERNAMLCFTVPKTSWNRCDRLLSYVEMDFQARDVQGFVHLHTHSEHSALDGISTIEEIIDAALADDQQAVAITDHGVCAGHPVLALAAEKKGIKPIFGMEAYLVDDRHARDGKSNDYWHLVLWAMDDEGLHNLWAMSTESYREGFYYKPRLDWDTLRRLNKGVMASTACLGGPLLDPWQSGDIDKAITNLAQLKDIFDDRLYIELHVNHLEQQIAGNHWLVGIAEQYSVPMVAVVDSHYATQDDAHAHRVWLGIQTNTDVQDDDTTLFAGDQDYHLMTEAEVREALSYLPVEIVDEAVRNTARVAARCTASMTGKGHNPVYTRKLSTSHEERAQLDAERLLDICLERWELRTGGKQQPQDEYLARFEREIELIIKKGFAGYFLMNWDLVSYAKSHGVLVGPGRGSGGGSLVAYVLGITEIDPVENDLLFERFMTEGRVELPDFDIDFPSSRKGFMLDYVQQRWGAAHIAIVGTHLRLKNKGAINDTARAMRSQLPDTTLADLQLVSKLIDAAEASTAGLGLSWDDLWAEHGEVLEPFRERYPELFAMAAKLRGRLKTYSKHAAGVIIDPDDELTDSLPLWSGTDQPYMTTQFDKNVLEKLGYVKFDMLNLRNLDTIQDCVDLIHEKTGRWISPYDWRDEYADPYVWDEISDGWTLGIFQVETTAGTRLTRRYRPQNVADLANIITLVRPGPTRSGLTETYFRRRTGEEETTFVDPRLKMVLAKTYGTLLYQENIMATTMALAGYGGDEADEVRKILGKKLVEKVAGAGRKFKQRAIENGTHEDVAELLWDQMAEFAKYTFNEAHAYAYAIIGYWTAWLKFHYPVQYLCASLSTIKQERIPEFVEEARRMGYQVLPPDVNESKIGFTAQQMSVRYGLMSIKGIGEIAAQAIIANQPYKSWEDFLERRDTKCNAGHIKTLIRIGTFDSLVPNRRGLETLVAEGELPAAERCVYRGPTSLVTMLPCVFDWPSEPIEVGRTGKPKKPKPPPKKCTRACRHFTERDPLDPLTVAPYTDEDIRRVEMEFLGVFLSSTPFDRLPDEDRQSVSTAMDVLTGPQGSYLIAGLVKAFRLKPGGDRYGRPMGWITFTTERGELDAVVFSKTYERFGVYLKSGMLAYATVDKNSRGQQLDLFQPLD